MTAATVRSFIDTNVLVYAESPDAGDKQIVATQLMRQHRLDRTGVLSTQVLQEFASVALRKLALPADLVRRRLAYFATYEIVPASAKLIAESIDLHQSHRISFWDALIVQAARQSGCVHLLTEDMNSGAVIAGVRLVNPFASRPSPASPV